MNRHGRHRCHGPRGWQGAPWWEALAENMDAIGRGFEEGGEFPFGEFSWGRKGRRGRGRMFAGGELRLVLLKLIADEPRHGYELMRAIEELTGGAYSPSPGTVYPTLSLLEDEGAIEECLDAESEGSRKAFAATEAGKAELVQKAEEARPARDGESAQRCSTPSGPWRHVGRNPRTDRRHHRRGRQEDRALVSALDRASHR